MWNIRMIEKYFVCINKAINCLLSSNPIHISFWLGKFQFHYWLNVNRCSNFCAFHTFARDLDLQKPLQILMKQNGDDDRIFILFWMELIMNECIQISALTFFCWIQLFSQSLFSSNKIEAMLILVSVLSLLNEIKIPIFSSYNLK